MGGKVAGVGAALTELASTGPFPESDVPAVLGAFDELKDPVLLRVVASDRLLSAALRFACVIVIVDMRVPAELEKPVRRVAESLPSCVAAPSRRSCTK